jgi:hypothetical protein
MEFSKRMELPRNPKIGNKLGKPYRLFDDCLQLNTIISLPSLDLQ